MDNAVVMVGVGEIGGVLARGLLRCGIPIYPVNRDRSMDEVATTVKKPRAVIVAVGEADLQPVLAAVPDVWRDRLVLLQNELLPRDWATHDLDGPTVISVWFEKKPGQDFKTVVASPVHGPHAALLADALQALNIPARILDDEATLLFELVRKNLYILTTNICGLQTGGTVSQLWSDHRDLATAIGDEVLDLQSWLTGESLDRDALFAAMVEAFEGDPDHKCMGRSAPARLQRALAMADEAGLEVPGLRSLAASQPDT